MYKGKQVDSVFHFKHHMCISHRRNGADGRMRAMRLRELCNEVLENESAKTPQNQLCSLHLSRNLSRNHS